MTQVLVNKPRYSWIDFSKFVGIMWVIMIHNPLLDFQLRCFLQSSTISIFFILSGYLYKPVSFKEGVKREFISLIIPFYIINLLGLVYTCLSSYFQLGILIGTDDIFPIVRDIFLGRMRSLDSGILAITLSTWFLCALFVLRLFAYVLNYLKLDKDWILIIISLLCATSAYYLKISGHEIFLFQINTALGAMPFFVMGVLFRKYDIYNKVFAINWVYKCVLLVVLLSFLIPSSQYNGRVNIFAYEYGQSVFLFYFNDFIGSFCVFLFCSFLNQYQSKYVTTIANGMIMILGTNILLVRYCYNFLSYFHLPYFYITPIFVALLVIAINYPLIVLSEKYFPLIIGRGFAKKTKPICEGKVGEK